MTLDPLRNKGTFTGYHDSHGTPINVGDLVLYPWFYGVHTGYQLHRICQADDGRYLRGSSYNIWSEGEGAVWPEMWAIEHLGLEIDEPNGRPPHRYIVYDKETDLPRMGTNVDLFGEKAAAQMAEDVRDLERRLLFGADYKESKPSD